MPPGSKTLINAEEFIAIGKINERQEKKKRTHVEHLLTGENNSMGLSKEEIVEFTCLT